MGVRLAPLDIQKKTFTKRNLGGIDESEVKEFLAEVAREFESLHAQERTHKEQVAVLRQRVNEYSEMERTLKQTMVSAQRSSSEQRQNAEKECELIIRNAELTAERIVDESRQEVKDLGEEVRALKKVRRKLRIELKNLLDGYYDLLEEESPETDSGRAPRGGSSPARIAGGG